MYQGNHFLVERLVLLKLNIVHKMILEWFFDYSSTKQMLELKDKEHPDIPFYWVYFDKIRNDLPLLPDNSNYKLNKYFDELCGIGKNNENKYPLIRKTFNTKHGNKVGFAIRSEVYLWLKGDNEIMPDGDFTKEIDFGSRHNKINKSQQYKLEPATKKVIEELEKIKIPNGTPLFKKLIKPEDDKHYSQTIKRLQYNLLQLYNGWFIEENINNLDQWFVKKYSYYISDKNIELIKECRHNWPKVIDLVVKTANRYAKWFKSTNEVLDKTKLNRTIPDFLFRPDIKISNFYLCLDKNPTEAKEVIAENMYNKLPSFVHTYFDELYNDEWDGMAYWNKIYSVYKWYKEHKDDLISENINYSYWFQGADTFMQGYRDFLVQMSGKLYLKHFGTNVPTWNWFIATKKEEHGINE